MERTLTIVTICSDADSAKELRGAMAVSERARLVMNSEDPERGYHDIVRLQPSAAIVVLGEAAEAGVSLIKRLTAVCPETALIAAARNASPALIMSSLRAGASEFLQLPVNPEEFVTVLSRVEEFCAERRVEQKSRGRIIAVFSSKGGSGTSFVTVNLAAALAAPTLLVDLNLQAGDLDSFLGADPRYSMTDVVKNLQRLDETLLDTFVTPHSGHLSLLAAPLEAHEAEDIRPEHLSVVLQHLRRRYSFVLLDLQHTFDPITVDALDQADDILLVLTLDIPGLRNTKRTLKIFDRIGYPREKVHILINRWSKNIDVELQKVERHLGDQIVGFIPNDYRKVMDSINLGKPLVLSEPASKTSAEIKRVAALLGKVSEGHEEAQPRKGLLKSLFGSKPAPRTALELTTTSD